MEEERLRGAMPVRDREVGYSQRLYPQSRSIIPEELTHGIYENIVHNLGLNSTIVQHNERIPDWGEITEYFINLKQL